MATTLATTLATTTEPLELVAIALGSNLGASRTTLDEALEASTATKACG